MSFLANLLPRQGRAQNLLYRLGQVSQSLTEDELRAAIDVLADPLEGPICKLFERSGILIPQACCAIQTQRPRALFYMVALPSLGISIFCSFALTVSPLFHTATLFSGASMLWPWSTCLMPRAQSSQVDATTLSRLTISIARVHLRLPSASQLRV